MNSTIIPLINCFTISIEDKLHTFVEHIAIQIAVALSKTEGKMLVTGCGAYHVFLLERMKDYLPKNGNHCT